MVDQSPPRCDRVEVTEGERSCCTEIVPTPHTDLRLGYVTYTNITHAGPWTADLDNTLHDPGPSPGQKRVYPGRNRSHEV